MDRVVLVIHLLIAATLVGVVLMQRSEGGGLGMGGSGGGGFMTARGTANLLTRTTAVLAGCFMVTSVALAILASSHGRPRSILDVNPAAETIPAPSAPAGAAPAPAAPAPAAPTVPAAPAAPSVPLAK